MRIGVLFPLLLLAGLGASTPSRGEITAADRAAYPGLRAWEIDCERPEEVSDVRIFLCYKFWDPKVDGDVPTRRELQSVLIRKAPARLAIKVFLGPGSSVIRVNDRPAQVGKIGFPLDASYAMAARPKANYDGFYILAQKSADPKHPVALGEVGEAAAWIQLETEFQP